MITEENLLDFAKKCARTYVVLRGARDYDDAVSEACVFLLAHREKWNDPLPKLKKRIVGVLTRNYQKERGLRLKRPPMRVELSWDVEGRVEDQEKNERLEKIYRGLEQPGVASNRLVVEAALEGKNKSEISRELGIGRKAVSQILDEYRRAVGQLADERGVQIVDGRDAGPLFSPPQ